jgi:hypothetical protein
MAPIKQLFCSTGQLIQAKCTCDCDVVICMFLFISDASRQVEEVIRNDNFVISLKHIKPRRRLRGSVETLFAVDFPGSQQKFVLMLDRRSKRGKPASFLYSICCRGETVEFKLMDSYGVGDPYNRL